MSNEEYEAQMAYERHLYDKADERDARIAALTERLRIMEAERDEARSGVKKSAEAYGALMEHAEKLRAELERKDAALTKAREDRAEAAERLSKQAARWLDDFIADSELIDAINGELAAALQPKEPPCQTA